MLWRRRQPLALAAIFLLLVAVGCNKRQAPGPRGTALQVPTKTAENGWPLYEKPADGFALTLPPGWKQYEMDRKWLEAALKDEGKRDPAMVNLLRGLEAQLAQGVRFFGIDESTLPSGFATNANVLKEPFPGIASLDASADLSLRQLDAWPSIAKPINHARLRIQGGEAERLHYVRSMTMPNGQAVNLAITQYLLVHGNDSYTVTLTTLDKSAAKYESTFDQIGQSFRFLDEQ
jgi:hypothetical protein